MKVIRRRDEDYPQGTPRPKFLRPVRVVDGRVVPAGEWVEVDWIYEGGDDDGDE